jgi:hypothetical protein
MKILLDECVPVQIRDALPEHEIHSADFHHLTKSLPGFVAIDV